MHVALKKVSCQKRFASSNSQIICTKVFALTLEREAAKFCSMKMIVFLSFIVLLNVSFALHQSGLRTKYMYRTHGSIENCRKIAFPIHATKQEQDLDVDAQLTVTLVAKSFQAFEIASSRQLTKEFLDVWDRQINEASSELRLLTNRDILLNVYAEILTKAAPQTLDPLQIATFDILTSAIVDRLELHTVIKQLFVFTHILIFINLISLIKLSPKNSPVTSLVDDITEVNLDCIEKFRKIVDNKVDDEDGYTDSQSSEYLCYQYAMLVRKAYDRLSKGLGADFDTSSSVQELRLNNWVAPIYARLQRRFVRFQASNVDDMIEEMTEASFDKILRRVKVCSKKACGTGCNMMMH